MKKDNIMTENVKDIMLFFNSLTTSEKVEVKKLIKAADMF